MNPDEAVALLELHLALAPMPGDWQRCGTCRAEVDAQCPEVGMLCQQGGCPYKAQQVTYRPKRRTSRSRGE